MKNSKLRKEIFLAAIFSLIYLALTTFRYHLEKLFEGINIAIVTYVCLGIISLLFIGHVYKIFRRRKRSRGRIKLKFVYYIPATILLTTILYTFSPIKFDSEKIEGKVILNGCYEGGNSQAFIRFRDDNNFEIKWMNETGLDEWYFGNYIKSKDTFFLTYIDHFPEKFGSIILNKGQTLVSLDQPHTEGGYFVPFYLGNCKGEIK